MLVYVNMKKIMIAWMIFGSKSLNSFPLSATYSFLKYLLYAYGQAEATLRIYTQVSIASVRPIF